MIKKFSKKDPYQKRESVRYKDPIPSRELILEYLEKSGKPQSKNDIERGLFIKKSEQKIALSRRLRAMVRDGQLLLNRKEQLTLIDNLALQKAKVVVKKSGFATLDFIDGYEPSKPVCFTPIAMREILDGDTVLVRISHNEENGRKIAVLVEILERSMEEMVGIIEVDEYGELFVPVQKQITTDIQLIASKVSYKHGDYVQAKIIKYPTRRQKMVVQVLKVIGDHAMAGLERMIAISVFNLPHIFSADALKYAKSLHDQPIQKEADRTDWRALPFVTIDGEDARDFDDAVFAEKQKQGWLLRVAIADVSNYVLEDSELDREAIERATSVYLPGSVIPMLPEVLSNDLCSLRPEEDRLVLGVEMHIGSCGKLQNYHFKKAIIRSKQRLTYTAVAGMIQGHEKVQTWFAKPLDDLYACYQALTKERSRRGSIDFDFPESKVQFDQQGKITAIISVERNIAHLIIEEAMLVANEACAGFIIQHQATGVFRVHPKPSTEKILNLKRFLDGMGISLPNYENIKPKDLKRLLDSVKSQDHAQAIQSVVLSTMSCAQYDTDNIGHFGLAYKHYCHFTSPIRRYPDLIVHRIIKNILANNASKTQQSGILKSLAKHCSRQERRADDASRYAMSWLKCQFMEDKEGKTYWGTISSVKSFGVFVTLDDMHVDGLLHITQLEADYYDYDPIQLKLVGRKNHKTYCLGQRIRVKVDKVNSREHQIDFTQK